jgi:Zn-dependent oligopeptidase
MQSYHPYPHPHHHTHTPPHTVQTIEKIIEVPIVKEIIKEIPNVEAETKINELVEKLKQSETQKAELWTNLDYLLNKHENDQIKAKETIKKTLSDELKKQEELIIKIKEKDEEIDTPTY